MKKILIVIIVCISNALSLNAQDWLIAKQAGGTQLDGASKIAVDHLGNIYLTGRFVGTSYFNNDTIQYFGLSNFFLAKYSSNGNLLWIKNGGGLSLSNYNGGASLKIDGSGNCYITGRFSGTTNFDTIQLTSNGSNDIFIAKYDSLGHCLWAKGAGGSDYDVSRDLELDANNNIYITGNFNSTIATFDTISLANPVNNKLFLAKYNNDGHCLWAKTTGGLGGSVGDGISFYNNKLYITGSFDSTNIFGTYSLTSATGYSNSLIAQYDTLGNCLWVTSGTRSGGNSISHDTLGNCYFTGYTLDTSTFGNVTISDGSNLDCFIAKYDTSGNFKWVKQLQASIEAWGYGITTNKIGNSYITGYLSGNAIFGSNTLIASGSQDIFVAKYDSSGNCLGAGHVGNSNGYGYGIATDASNNCYISGQFEGIATFSSTTLTSYGQTDIFWAKMDTFTGYGEGGRLANNQLFIYANPNKGTCNITIPDEFNNEKSLLLTVYDNNGKIIQQSIVTMNQDKVKLNIEALAKGVYNVTLCSAKKCYNGKIVFE